MTLNQTSVTLAVGGTETLTATVAPENATDKTVTFTSNDDKVATVTPKQGKITAAKAGTVQITTTTSNGKKAVCEVEVTEKE